MFGCGEHAHIQCIMNETIKLQLKEEFDENLPKWVVRYHMNAQENFNNLGDFFKDLQAELSSTAPRSIF